MQAALNSEVGEIIVSAAHASVAELVLSARRQTIHRRVQDLSAVELVRHCLKSGEHAAWCEFVQRFQPVIASVIIKTVRHWGRPEPGLVDDMVQDTYLKLFADDFRPLRKFSCRHENAFFGFLKVVASNVVQDHFRSMYCRKRGSGKPDDELEHAAAEMAFTDASVEAIEQHILLSQIEDRLNNQAADPQFTRNRTIFTLYYHHGLTAEAISRLPEIGLTPKGVESTLSRLLRTIKVDMNCSRN